MAGEDETEVLRTMDHAALDEITERKDVLGARLNLDGTLDDTFNANIGNHGYIMTSALQADGKILVGGYSGDGGSIGGQQRLYMARLEPITGMADSFNPSPDQPPFAVVVQPDGKILIGGYFTTAGGQARNFIASLDPVTGAADSFNADACRLVCDTNRERLYAGTYFSAAAWQIGIGSGAL